MIASENSFSKAERLKQPAEFRGILRNARSIRENGVSLYFLENASTNKNRLGVVVSKRIFKRAVDRNRVKRITREFFRSNKPKLQANFDFVVKIIDGSKLFDDNNLEKSLNHLFHRVGAARSGE